MTVRNNADLRARAILERDDYCTIADMERATGENRGTIYRVIYENGNSRRLRRLWDIPLHPKRTRICIDCTDEMVEEYDAQRGEMTRKEYFAMLLEKDVS